MQEEEIKMQMQKLRQHRQNHAKLKKHYEEAFAEFQEEMRGVLNEMEAEMAEINHVENKLRQEALEIFNNTGEKQLPYGLGIRVEKKVDYDPETAFNWAVNHQLCLKLDIKAFEKLAKTQNLDIVQIREEPKATIPRNIEVE